MPNEVPAGEKAPPPPAVGEKTVEKNSEQEMTDFFAKLNKQYPGVDWMSWKTATEWKAMNANWDNIQIALNAVGIDKLRKASPIAVGDVQHFPGYKEFKGAHFIVFDPLLKDTVGIQKQIEDGLAVKEVLKNAPSKLPEVTPKNYDTLIKKNPRLVLLKTGETWCKPCKKYAPLFRKLQAVMGDQVQIVSYTRDSSENRASGENSLWNKIPFHDTPPNFSTLRNGKEENFLGTGANWSNPDEAVANLKRAGITVNADQEKIIRSFWPKNLDEFNALPEETE